MLKSEKYILCQNIINIHIKYEYQKHFEFNNILILFILIIPFYNNYIFDF